jgi:DNA-binding PadR family transcriptional regulator
VTETRQQRNRRLYGRKRVPRSHRKIMLVLLAVSSPMAAYSLARAGMTRQYGPVQVALAAMQSRDWIKASTGEGRRRCYQVTYAGRMAIMELLDLPRG